MFLQREYRLNVAIVIVNLSGKVLWCQRKEHDGWQFPQGGIDKGETPLEAAIRETKEEVGLDSKDIEIVHESQDWFKYEVPKDKRSRYFTGKKFVGQKQKWFLARLLSDDTNINLKTTRPVEFDNWIWASYWHALNTVVPFKKEVYREALLSILPEYNQLNQ